MCSDCFPHTFAVVSLHSMKSEHFLHEQFKEFSFWKWTFENIRSCLSEIPSESENTFRPKENKIKKKKAGLFQRFISENWILWTAHVENVRFSLNEETTTKAWKKWTYFCLQEEMKRYFCLVANYGECVNRVCGPWIRWTFVRCPFSERSRVSLLFSVADPRESKTTFSKGLKKQLCRGYAVIDEKKGGERIRPL